MLGPFATTIHLYQFLMAVKWLLMNSTPKSCDEAKFEVSFLVLWHVKQSIRLERHRHTHAHTYTCEYIAFCSRLSQVELSWVLLQIALAFCYVNLFSLFRLFFLCLESTRATSEGCGDTQFTADLCNVYNMRYEYMVYDTYIFSYLCCVPYT